MPTTVAIVEDNLEIRESWLRLINDAPGFRCVCACESGEEAFKKVPRLLPDVVLMDIQLEGMSGIECTARLKRALPQIQVLMLTVYADNELIFNALKAGASGYLLKRSTTAEVLEAIEDVKRGGAPMTSEIARKVVESFRQPIPRGAEIAQLSAREEEILGLLAKGYISKEIADRLHISFDTVRSHLKHIYEKLHVRSRTEAVVKYLSAEDRPVLSP